MPTFNFRVTDDLTVPIQADNQQDALKILKAELAKRERHQLLMRITLTTKKVLRVKNLDRC